MRNDAVSVSRNVGVTQPHGDSQSMPNISLKTKEERQREKDAARTTDKLLKFPGSVWGKSMPKGGSCHTNLADGAAETKTSPRRVVQFTQSEKEALTAIGDAVKVPLVEAAIWVRAKTQVAIPPEERANALHRMHVLVLAHH